MTTATSVREPDLDPTLDFEPTTPQQPSMYSRYMGAMLYFMGAALIAGAVVHYPINPRLYSIICVCGAIVFTLGTIVNEFILAPVRPAIRRAVSLVLFSLALSFGVGLVGGGIQHFEQFPERSALMTPIGLVLSYVAFVAKDAEGTWRALYNKFAAGVVVVAALTWFGMWSLVPLVGSGGHDHGASTPAAVQSSAPEVPSAPSAPSSAPQTAAPLTAAPHSGHDHGAH